MTSTDALTAIFTRRSIRRFSPRPIDGHTQEILLRAAFAAPASENAQTRRFIVIAQRDRLDQLPALHPSAGPAREAPLAILLCCDTSASPQTVFWPQDCAAAAENLMLAARALGIGSLWCGIHPVEAREQAFMKAFGLPGYAVCPVSSPDADGLGTDDAAARLRAWRRRACVQRGGRFALAAALRAVSHAGFSSACPLPPETPVLAALGPMLDAAGAMGDWTLRSRFTFCPAVWAAAFRAGACAAAAEGRPFRWPRRRPDGCRPSP